MSTIGREEELNVLDEIPLELTIVLGSTEVPISQILKMGRGSIIPLDCGQDDPTLVYANNQLIARGQIQVNGDAMSVEITDVVRRRK